MFTCKLAASWAASLTFFVLMPAAAAGDASRAGAPAALPGYAAASDDASARILNFAAEVTRSGDSGGRAFGVIDKPGATLWVFDERGRALAQTPVIVGEALGDVAPADIGSRPLSRVKKHEKITAAGRYLTEGGNNHKGEDIVWLDYDSALSMHRVRNVKGESRTQRLQSPGVQDNRISFGCVNIPASFYDRMIDPMFSRSSGVVYVLPESKAIASVFPFAGGAAGVHELAQSRP